MKFHPHALAQKGFNWDAAISLVNACHLAYKSEDAVRHVFSEAWSGARVLQVFSSGSTQAYVVEADEYVLCAFRGPDTFGDWFTNIGTAKIERPYGTVHRGFFLAYRRAETLVEAYVQRASEGSKAFWLTGHSLGGAIAQIAAHEVAGRYDRIGVYTFGQPRTVNAAAAHRLTGSLGLDYHRVVNNDDVVPRIPPDFGHSGRLIHFDALGRPRNGLGQTVGRGAEMVPALMLEAAEIGSGSTEPPPISAAAFERHQEQVRRINAELAAAEIVETGPLYDRDRALDATIEGIMPGVRDCRITEYVRLISRVVVSETRKYEPPVDMLRRLSTSKLPSVGRIDTGRLVGLEAAPRGPAVGVERAFARTEAEIVGFGINRFEPGSTALMPLLLKISVSDWVPPDGARVQSRIGDYVTLLADDLGYKALQADNAVNAIELSRDAGIAELDRSLSFVKCDQLHRPPIDERGDAALVGIVDSGVDILHKAFLDDGGKTRILAIWNQRDQRGPAPNAVDPAFKQDYGTLDLHADLQSMIDVFEQLGQAPHWLLRDGESGHGTHVAGIAAGRATSVWSDGMAPEARLVVVIPNMMTAAGDPQSMGYSVSHVDALEFLRTAARGGNAVLAQAKPIAINVSIGMNAGAHDGSTLLESAVDSVTGGGRDAGIVIVKSAGNECSMGGHARLRLIQGKFDLEWESEDVDRDLDYLEAWYDPSDDLSFALRTPFLSRSQQVDLNTRESSEVLDGNLCQMKLTRLHHDNGKSRLVISISPDAEPIRRGRWKLELQGNAIRTTRAELNVWVERMDNIAVRFVRDDDETTLSIPGTANRVITVGASDIGPMPRLMATSSLGLTGDGRAKPDIAAPGDGVTSARADQADREAVISSRGTSMAAPHVTGALALALSRRAKTGRAQFNANQLQQTLLATARRVAPAHDPGFGHGILDAEALLRELDREP